MPKNTVLLLLTFAFVPGFSIAKPPVIGELLETVSKRAPEIRATVTGLKLVDLPMSYREGMRLERYQQLAIKSVERIEKITAVAKRRPSLDSYYAVSIDLRNLTDNLQEFADLLDEYSSSNSAAQEKAAAWAEAVAKLLDPLHASMLDFEDSLHSVLEKADALIVACEAAPPK